MPEAIPIAATRWIRDCELDEVWLQDQIADFFNLPHTHDGTADQRAGD